MLDKNDRKYIIRRVITYIAIAMIMFFISSCQANALEVQSAQFTMPRMYITSNGQQSAYNVQQITFNGTYMQGYQSSTINNITKFAFELPVGFKTLMKEYEYVSFQTFNNASASFTANIGIECEKEVSTYIDSGATYGQTDSTINAGYTSYVCRINHTSQDYISFYGFTNGISQLFISKEFYFFNTGEGETASAINDVNNSLNDSTPPSSNEISGSSSEWNSYNSDNGVINNLVLMPVTLLNSFVNGMNNSCSSYDLGELWGEHIILPCINLSQMLGTVWSIIDIILSGVFIFVFGKQCVKIFNDFTNLRSGQIDTLYGGGN